MLLRLVNPILGRTTTGSPFGPSGGGAIHDLASLPMAERMRAIRKATDIINDALEPLTKTLFFGQRSFAATLLLRPDKLNTRVIVFTL